MDQDGPGWTEMDQDGPRWAEMDRDGPRWTRMDRDGQGRSFCRLGRPVCFGERFQFAVLAKFAETGS